MEYISVSQAAEKWGIGIRRVQFFCSNDKIPGAVQMGKQWIIPKDAERPLDGRTKNGKIPIVRDNYRFPLYVFSRDFSNREDLTEEEKELFDAQMLYLKGEYPQAKEALQIIFDNTENPVIKYAAKIFTGYTSLVLGLYQSYMRAAEYAEKVIEHEEKHKEDYKLMYYSLKYHVDWDSSLLLAIDSQKLSLSALDYYQSMILMVSSFTGKLETNNSLLIYETLCSQMETNGSLISAEHMHFYLTPFYGKAMDMEKMQFHADKAIKIAIKYGLIGTLAKHFYLTTNIMKKSVNTKTFNSIKELADKNILGWVVVSKEINGILPYPNISAEDIEMVHLVLYGLSNKEIAILLHSTPKKINAKISSICEALNLQNRKALIEYAKLSFSGEKQ